MVKYWRQEKYEDIFLVYSVCTPPLAFFIITVIPVQNTLKQASVLLYLLGGGSRVTAASTACCDDRVCTTSHQQRGQRVFFFFAKRTIRQWLQHSNRRSITVQSATLRINARCRAKEEKGSRFNLDALYLLQSTDGNDDELKITELSVATW